MTYRAKTLYKGDVAKNYDKERFSSWKGKLYDWFEKRSITKAMYYMPKHFKVLDIPCGTGRITEHIKNLGYHVEGADTSEDMLRIGMRRIGIPFHKQNILHMEFPDKKYAVITCVRLTGHLPHRTLINALKEMKRVAAFLVVTFYTPKKKRIGHWYTLTEKEIEMTIEDCGLGILERHYVCKGWSDGITYVMI